MNTLRSLAVPAPARSRIKSGQIWRGLGVTTAVVGVAGFLGGRFAPAPVNPDIRRFYRRLDKPPFNPPDAAFGIWGPLYAMTILSGLRVWNTPNLPARRRAISLWVGTQALNTLWLWLGFKRRELGAGTVVALASVATTAAYVDTARDVDRPAAALAVPLVAWLCFATLLTEELWRRNR